MTRAGIAQALEAVIAALLLLSFVIGVLPAFGGEAATIPTTTLKARQTLAALDAAGDLRPHIADRNLSGIDQGAAPYFPGKETAVAVRWVNATVHHRSFTGSVTDTVPVNASTVTRGVLRIWYRDGNAVNVTVNGDAVINHTAAVNGVQEAVTVTGQLVDGANTVTVDADGAASLVQRLAVTHEQVTEQPPGSAAVRTGSYLVPGDEHFLPAEVTLLVW